ncbi:YidB family protein [Roseixanthobacter pseudopolyaromaticivorans]|uniref:YidB family protein n=1 Tax=Xanthobacteraceae TaxID=335928 RepID=UPI00372D271F
MGRTQGNTMGLFDSLGALGQGGGLFGGLLNSVLSGGLGQNLPAMLNSALAGTPYGNLDGLLEQLKSAGLGEQVTSWLSNGENLPISATDLTNALDMPVLAEVAGRLGLPADMLPNLMAQYLPGLIDKLSPNGALETPPPV